MVKRTTKPYDYWLGIVVKIEVTKKKLYKSRPPQDFHTIWVKWTIPELLLKGVKPESYWVEDLEVVAKAQCPQSKKKVVNCG